MRCPQAFAIASIAGTAAIALANPRFAASTIDKVRTNAISAAAQSWEIGTMMEAVVEHDSPHLSVFQAGSVPVSSYAKLPGPVKSALDKAIAKKPKGAKYYFSTGAVGDSASIGVTALMAGISTGQSAYFSGAKSQLDYLLYDTPRYGNTISHRRDYFQAWADFISMAPPFIAYSAVAGNSQSQTLLTTAYQQCKGYRSLLQDPSTGLWRHIVYGPFNDTGLWATGNAWAAHGMLRVQQTIAKSVYASKMTKESQDLLQWTGEILDAVWARQHASGAVANYMDRKNQFEDSAGTALLAAATYRVASIQNTSHNIAQAERALNRVMALVDKNGWLQGAVDPLDFDQQAKGHSPEGQSFVLMLDAASRAYYDAQSRDALAPGLSANETQYDA